MQRDSSPGLGTLLRHLLVLLDGDLERVYASLGVDYRPRYTPVYRELLGGPCTIRGIASRAGITHSAASQTIAHMSKVGLVELKPGIDRRERIVMLTSKGRAIRSRVENQWAITSRAAEQLDRQLSVPLTGLLKEAIAALDRQSFFHRIEVMNAKEKRRVGR